ncbi:MAG: excalibur calcium-binding domain-containing protein [Sphingobium sp.]
MAQFGMLAIYAGGAALLGTAVGIGSLPQGRVVASGAIKAASAATDMRKRPPQAGDNWGGCNDARAAGTAPIYRGEPGYRANMDGDNDGIACEPHHGL